jgi:uncharacterized protein (DUF2147 family)
MSYAALLALSLASLRAAAEPVASPIGHWVNPAESVIVEISTCGDDLLCGHVRWASIKAASDARAKGTEPLTGTQLLLGFAPAGPGRWRGRLFVPDLRKTSHAELRVIDDQQLKVVGCAAVGLICKSQIWRRVDPATVPPPG